MKIDPPKRINGWRGVYVHQTGEYFPNCSEAARDFGIPVQQFHLYLTNPKRAPEWFCELQICFIEKDKVCAHCRILLTEENNASKGSNYLCKKCRQFECRAERFNRDEELVTFEQIATMYEEQQGRCAICNRHESEFKKALSIDHNHKTKQIRGLLCSSCNRALGAFQGDDGIEILCAAINYLRSKDDLNVY